MRYIITITCVNKTGKTIITQIVHDWKYTIQNLGDWRIDDFPNWRVRTHLLLD